MAFASGVEVSTPAVHAAPQLPPVSAPVLGEYTDFRQYLKDVYEFKRMSEGTGLRPYSYSTFSAAADIKSPNYLKLIIEGRRNLSEDMMTRFAKALRLTREETVEFKALVRYGQAHQPIERNQFLKELADLRARRELDRGVINQRSWDKVPSWIGWVLYAMADQRGVEFDPEKVLQMFRLKASPDDIRDSMRKLFESGELVRDEVSGNVTKPREMIESPQDLPVALIRKLQAELIYLGIESLFNDSPKDREFGSLTMALTQEEFEQVRFEVRQLRKRLHKDVSVKRKSTKGDRVYQLNIQLFPLTEKSKRSESLGEN
ncbi:MAG: TIGR02147 family protein [Bdellovibrionaceae bacterium]|nr:TIGR02147 family protein [Pseudobdellovibrionaceae bacterium]